MFPDERERFDEWRQRMLAYAAATDVLSALLSPPKCHTHTKRMDDVTYAQWLVEVDEKKAAAELVLNDKRNTTKAHEDEDVITIREITRARKAVNILFQSFKQKQLSIVNTVFQENPHEMWKAINAAYGVVNTTDTIHSLLDQLHEVKKSNSERVQEYISRIDRLMTQLSQLNSVVPPRMRKHYILRGLRHLSQWKLSTDIIVKLDSDGEWTAEKLEQYLVSEENKQIVDSSKLAPDSALSASSSSNTTHTHNDDDTTHSSSHNNNPFHMQRGRSRGRGYRGRGRGWSNDRGGYRGRGNSFSHRGGRGSWSSRGGSDRGRGGYNRSGLFSQGGC